MTSDYPYICPRCRRSYSRNDALATGFTCVSRDCKLRPYREAVQVRSSDGYSDAASGTWFQTALWFRKKRRTGSFGTARAPSLPRSGRHENFEGDER